MHALGPPHESLERNGISRPAKPFPNPDDAGPIIRSLMGLPAATQLGIEAKSVVTPLALP